MENTNIKVEINFIIDLNKIKNSLENKKQILNNDIVLDYIKNNILNNALNSANFIDMKTNKNGTKGFLNQLVGEFENKA